MGITGCEDILTLFLGKPNVYSVGCFTPDLLQPFNIHELFSRVLREGW
jgi:hypothetical protein